MTTDQPPRPPSTPELLDVDRESGTYHARYEPTENSAASTAVVEVIAEIEARDPLDLPERLYDRVDPDALDALLRPPGHGRSPPVDAVEFVFDTYHVRVQPDGLIVVRPNRP